jgi:hypothetical protein
MFDFVRQVAECKLRSLVRTPLKEIRVHAECGRTLKWNVTMLCSSQLYAYLLFFLGLVSEYPVSGWS